MIITNLISEHFTEVAARTSIRHKYITSYNAICQYKKSSNIFHAAGKILHNKFRAFDVLSADYSFLFDVYFKYMKEKIPDLNQMRDQIAKLKELSNEIPDNNEMSENVNTLERFEALPIEEQVQRMEQKGYTDLELFNEK